MTRWGTDFPTVMDHDPIRHHIAALGARTAANRAAMQENFRRWR